MVKFMGRGSGTLADDDLTQLPFLVDLEVSLSPGWPVEITKVVVTATGTSPVTSDVLKKVATSLDEFADHVGANVARQAQLRAGMPLAEILAGTDAARLPDMAADVDVVWTSEDVILGPRFVREAQAELLRRRRSRLTAEEFEAIANVYRRALDEGLPVQQEVARLMGVTTSRAGRLIQETRQRGLLPPAKKGRWQSV